MARLRVAVLMGGRSSEHEISVASARSVLESLDPDRYEVRSIEIARDGRWGSARSKSPATAAGI
jgi:D-alanine-D-alanine ligase